MELGEKEKVILQQLHSWRLFSPFTEEELKDMLPLLEPEYTVVGQGETVLSVGDTVNRLYLVTLGRFEERRVHNGTEIHDIGLYKIGGMFGLYGTGSSEKTSPVNVVALDNGELLSVRLDKVSAVPMYSERLLKALYIEARDLSVRLVYRVDVLSAKRVRGKLMAYFQAMRDKHGSNVFTVKMTQSELADYLKVDRTNLSVELKRLREEGVLKMHNDKVYEILSWDTCQEKSNRHDKQQKH